jgi:hypothetical protein
MNVKLVAANVAVYRLGWSICLWEDMPLATARKRVSGIIQEWLCGGEGSEA